ncbi:hypothetical protein DPMN_077394 [Dreissena polymorpha]|uniref:Uncharacterized protein n=1 Tax=Dreissena polymorpha TaxID=45954 RepID=A0A9D4BPK3_DREPO|nr:hypothetical protein DPMN_077394 [Dreissena polymorpha]
MEFLAQHACRNLVGDVWNGQRFDDALNKISYLVFLSLFAYVLLFDLKKTVSTQEFVLIAWVLTILVEETRQCAAHELYELHKLECFQAECYTCA